MKVENNVAVVTGGSSGLGLATAKRLSNMGAKVFVLDRQKPPSDALGTAHFAECDVTDEDGVRRAFEEASALGPVRIVVNCAGIGDPQRVLSRDGSTKPLAPFRHVLQVNLVGTFTVLSIGAGFIAQTQPQDGERGVIVNTASVAAFDGQIGQAAYSASKGGVAAMTLPLARDLAQSLIRVVAVAPGIFRTPLLSTLPEAAQVALGEQIPHPKRLGEPDEFAALVEHIIGNPMLNGEVIRLDGAIRMGPR
ncbi:SDR family NAD(P)-dependent oxidoreductase [Amycolatopsis pithecellobii]|uniref:SDR family NAD(P)-dependent oxidoreductase n=1 Tax=Amycolatopsis pithecellobii TaxID=664692 RepID=A0A6N7YZW5_9PSEU|nr:SDR family NAD(P)-dependent oxidoreductase [Amycolatopsis pithecellobii]MTD53031.1 SDR family NAD(P)-dependent oxidoreductase [Amycolatopsis pithecellobii]